MVWPPRSQAVLLAPSRRGEVEVAELALAARDASEVLAARGEAAPDVPEVSDEPPPEAWLVPALGQAEVATARRAESGPEVNWGDLGQEGEWPGSAETEPGRSAVPLEGPGLASAGPAAPEGWK